MTDGVHPGGADGPLRAAVDRRFEAVVFDWDGTAVPDRSSDASEVRALVEELCATGMDLAIVSGTHVGNVDGQLRARPTGPGSLVLALNRGSEVFVVDHEGPHLVTRREATPQEDAALTRAAELTVARLAARGLDTAIVSQRLNRRKIDLIPLSDWADPPKARMRELLEAVQERLRAAGLHGLPEVVELALGAAREAGLPDPRVTSDAKHVEIGLTDKSDSASWIFGELWRRGIGSGLVLVAGDELGPLGRLAGSDSLMLVPEARRATVISVGVEPEGIPDGVLATGGGPNAFTALLADQLRRRRDGDVPEIDADPAWTLAVDGFDPERERADEALLTLSDGRIGTSGAPNAAPAGATPMVLAAGVYHDTGAMTSLRPGPVWHCIARGLDHDARLRRVLDLRTGVLHETVRADLGTLTSLRFSSLARPGTVALRAHLPAGFDDAVSTLVPPDDATGIEEGIEGGVRWMRVPASPGGITAAARDRIRDAEGGSRLVERIGVYVTGDEHLPEAEDAVAGQVAAEADGYDRLLTEHRVAWARRWEEADVVIEGDDELQHAVRVALFHLMASASDIGEAAVGARGLTGPAYRGHVFWDADTFVLPFLAATHPAAARAVLEYRVRRLPAARARARAEGLAGARFPWESAGSGTDVTPESARDGAGRIVPVRTGSLEEHIVAEVAWAACTYGDWTGDESFVSGPGRELLLETARFWAGRIRVAADGSAHILDVIGPDEYHEPVDDSAFTNAMARWNLRRAAAEPGASTTEQGRWHELADALVDGYDPETGIYEEFAGFSRLEPLIIEEIARRRPVAADLLLGAERVHEAQVVKQADVLMLHHLLPDDVEPGSLEPNLRYYEPRTAHGSSLSPGIHAALFARARDYPRALDALRIAARIDLDDLTGATAGGLHLGAMGSVWQALAFGFLGLRPRGDVLTLDPRLPPEWSALELRVTFRGTPVRLRKEHARLIAHAGRPLVLALGDLRHPVGPEGVTFRREHHAWRVESPT